MKNIVLILSCLVLVNAGSALATPILFDDMGDANAYVFGDFSAAYSDSQNALWVGGDATLNGYTVATLNDWNAIALHVRGDLTMVGGDINGLAAVEGGTTVSQSSALRQDTITHRFDQAYFNALATRLSEQEAAQTYIQHGAFTALGSANTDTLFINVNQQLLDSAWGLFTRDLTAGSRIIFNVAGEDVTLSSQKDWLVKDVNYAFTHAANNVLFNFYEAKSLNISGGIYGSILAPNADVTTGYGVLNGQLIANSFAGNIQLNDAPFSVDSPAASVHEPTPLFLFMAGLISFIFMRVYSTYSDKKIKRLGYSN